ncbi:MAG: hypothetical protein ACHBMF_03730 [Chromatiales bacterium]
MKIYYDDDRPQPGPYRRGVVYEVEESEARRLIEVEGFVAEEDPEGSKDGGKEPSKSMPAAAAWPED